MTRRTPATAAARPYAPSWLDLVLDRIETLPGPSWLAYAVLLAASVVLRNVAFWLSGVMAWGQIDPPQTVYGAVTVALLAGMHHLRCVAGSAFDAFRPALGTGIADPEHARYDLTVVPARLVLAITILVPVMLIPYYTLDPATVQVAGLTGAGLAIRVGLEGLTLVTVIAIVCQALRQMRRISGLHQAAEVVDPLEPAPLFAFSRVTARVGVIVILFATVSISVTPESVTSGALATILLQWHLAILAAAVAAFVVPLLGMHRRLAVAKDELVRAAARRQRVLVDELRAAIDARETGRIEALDRTLSAHRHERELVGRAPTWPWSTGTIRGFGSAILLPITIYLVQRFIGGLLG